MNVELKKDDEWLEMSPEKVQKDQKTYDQLLDKFIPKMIGEENAKKLSIRKNPTEWVTVPMIAFVIVSIENYESVANKAVKEGGKLKGEKGKFTKKGEEKSCGYSIEGIKKHSEVCEKLEKWWDEERAAVKSDANSFGKAYLDRKKKEVDEMTEARKVKGVGKDANKMVVETVRVKIYGYDNDSTKFQDMVGV